MVQFLIKKEDLEKLYIQEELSIRDCANILNVTSYCIKKHFKLFGIEARKNYAKTKNRYMKLVNSSNIGSKTKEYYKKIKETGIIPENELRRRAKIGNWSKKFKRTDDHKENIGRALLGNKNCLGREVSKKTKIKISESLKELYKDKTKHPLYGKHHSKAARDKISYSHLKENLSDGALQAYRESAIARIERQQKDGLPLTPSIGRQEKEILDRYEEMIGCKIERQYRIAGFFVDGYCKEKNTVFEVDEDYHKKRKKQDIYRDEIIRRELNCDIIRIKVIG